MKTGPMAVKWLTLVVFAALLLAACSGTDQQADGDSDGNQPECNTDSDCPDGWSCDNSGICINSSPSDGDVGCSEDKDCGNGYYCDNGTCMPDAADGDKDADADSDLDADVDNDGDGDQDNDDDIEQEEELVARISGPQSIDLPPLLTDQTVLRPLTVSSSGSGPLTINDIAILEGASPDISLQNLPEFPKVLPKGEVLSISIFYEQSNIGYDEATIQISSDASNSPELKVLAKVQQIGDPNLRCEPSPLDFGKIDIETLGDTRVITCYNDPVSENDDNLLEISSLEIYPPATTVFDLGANVPNSLFVRSGQSVDIPIEFSPRFETEETALLKLYHNSASADSPLAIDLTGSGGFKEMEFEPTSVNFGAVSVSDVVRRTITFTSTGAFPVHISSIQRGANLPEVFTIDSGDLFADGPATLQPNEVATVDIVFAPTADANYFGTIIIVSDGLENDSTTVNIAGSGANIILNFDEAEYDFGPVRTESTETIYVKVSNEGNQPALVTDLEIIDENGVFALADNIQPPFTIVADDFFAFGITFTPGAEQAYEGELVLTADNPSNPTIRASIVGRGALPHLRLEPEELYHHFGEVNIGGSKQSVFHLFNDGEASLTILDVFWAAYAQDPNAMISYEFVGEPIIEPSGQRLIRVTMAPPMNPIGILPLAAERTLQVDSDDEDNGELQLALMGTAVSPLVEIDPAGPTYSFGNQPPGYEANPIQVTLTNQGTGTLIIDDIHLTSDSNVSFWLTDLPTNFPVEIAPGRVANLVFSIHYRPAGYGNHSGTLRVVNRGYADTNLSIALSGAGENCPAGSHNCSGTCVDDDQPENCGSFCVPCPQPEHSVATCEAWLSSYRCEFECLDNFEKEGDLCVPINTDVCCGEDCEDCTLLTGDFGDWVCDDETSACALDCDPYYHPSEGECIPNQSADCCGQQCTQCETYANSDPTCLGEPGQTYCDIDCWDGYGNCNSRLLDGCEIDTTTNVNHCSACRLPCLIENGTPACVDSVCQINGCSGFYEDCNGLVSDGCEANLNTDPDNCSECGNVCAGDNGSAYCSYGACAMQTCDSGYRDCNGDYIDGCEVSIQTNPNHCGACNYKCVLSHAIPGCEAAECTVADCAEGYEDCDGLAYNGCETSTDDDVYNCGDCDALCLPANAIGICGGGTCHVQTCLNDYQDCNGIPSDGCEADLDIDPDNCGACNNACSYANANGVCNMRHCGMGSCLDGFSNCNGSTEDGCEVNKLIDNANCGGCNIVCQNPPHMHDTTCVDGSCQLGECDTGWENCNGNWTDGCETNIFDDRFNCGACDNVCDLNHATEICDNATCKVETCTLGWDNCDNTEATGCETPINTPTACGSCTNVCDLPHVDQHACVASECKISTCDDDWGHCDTNHTNGCETYLVDNDQHCGSCENDCYDMDHGVGTCTDTSCEVDSCANGWGDCSGGFGDGCEYDLTTLENTCGSAVYMRRASDDSLIIRGDSGNDVTHTYEGVGEQWLSVEVREDNAWCEPLWVLIVLDVPDGVDYDVELYMGGCDAENYVRTYSNGGVGQDESFVLCNDDDFDNENNFGAAFHIKFKSGSGCEPWSITAYGHQDGISHGCSCWFKDGAPPPDPSTIPMFMAPQDSACEIPANLPDPYMSLPRTDD